MTDDPHFFDSFKDGRRARPIDADPEPPKPNGAADHNEWKVPDYVLQKLPLATWVNRNIPEPDFVLGEVISTTSRLLLVAPTGLGKTNFCLALAVAIATGAANFLHWTIPQPRRVLYIDGEMSDRLMKKRAVDAVRRNGSADGQLFILSREDFPDMPPLNTETGQQYVDRIIDIIGGVDLVFFDNIQALLAGDMKDEVPWQQTLPWVRDLTRRGIGQVWIHHTGHDETHAYGTKTREWQLDAALLLESIERPEADIAFSLKFTKARERTPDNQADFAPAVITLTDDTWMSEKGNLVTSRRRTSTDLALDVLKDEIARGNGAIPSANERIPPNTLCLNTGMWRKAYELRSLAETKEAAKRAFFRDTKKLIDRKLVAKHDLWVWPVQ